MSPLPSKEEMYAMDYGDGSGHDTISTEMLEYIYDIIQSHPKVNQREACYKIRDSIRRQM